MGDQGIGDLASTRMRGSNVYAYKGPFWDDRNLFFRDGSSCFCRLFPSKLSQLSIYIRTADRPPTHTLRTHIKYPAARVLMIINRQLRTYVWSSRILLRVLISWSCTQNLYLVNISGMLPPTYYQWYIIRYLVPGYQTEMKNHLSVSCLSWYTRSSTITIARFTDGHLTSPAPI